jgi:hypothetical protein
VLKIKLKQTVLWTLSFLVLWEMIKGTPTGRCKQEDLSGAEWVKISVAGGPKSLAVCFNVFFFQGPTDPIPEALCFHFYVNHEMMDRVQKDADSEGQTMLCAAHFWLYFED